MRQHHQRRLRRRKIAKKAHPQSFDQPRGLSLSPPPRETGPEHIYRVFYVIDVNAPDPRQAAVRVHQIMTDPTSILPVLDILDADGRWTRIDLSRE